MFLIGDSIQDSLLAQAFSSEPVFSAAEIIHVVAIVILASILLSLFRHEVIENKKEDL